MLCAWRQCQNLLQLELAKAQGSVAKQREFLWRLAEAEDRLGELEPAEDKLKELLGLQLDSEEQRLQALCFLADMQVLVAT